MVNPYFFYCFAFICALVTYIFGWSDLYPALTLPLLAFLAITIIVAFVLGIITTKSRKILFKPIDTNARRYPLLITLFIYILWTIEFLYAGGIPLLKILLKQPYDYRVFGVPSLHVFIVTFSSFYTIYLFHLYLSKKSKIILLLYLFNLIASLLIYNRAMLFFNLAATTSLYVTYRGTITKKQIAAGISGAVMLFFFFGVLGSLRVSREAKKTYSNDDFLQTGKASESFRKSIIPSEFFWTYIYLSSPLANLQNNINTYDVKPVTTKKFFEWINNEVSPDFISKRINAYININREEENTIPGPFNATTIFSRSFSYLGWAGLVSMFIVLSILPIAFLKLLSDSSPFFLTGIAILNTMFLFSVFDNTLRFTGLSFQLVYPIALNFAIPRSGILKKFFT